PAVAASERLCGAGVRDDVPEVVGLCERNPTESRVVDARVVGAVLRVLAEIVGGQSGNGAAVYPRAVATMAVDRVVRVEGSRCPVVGRRERRAPDCVERVTPGDALLDP